jgi:hypothetical protein
MVTMSLTRHRHISTLANKMNTIAFIQNLGGSELLFLLFWALVVVVPFWQIFKRIGWHPALSLLALIPGVVIIMIYVVAFGKWKETQR